MLRNYFQGMLIGVALFSVQLATAATERDALNESTQSCADKRAQCEKGDSKKCTEFHSSSCHPWHG